MAILRRSKYLKNHNKCTSKTMVFRVGEELALSFFLLVFVSGSKKDWSRRVFDTLERSSSNTVEKGRCFICYKSREFSSRIKAWSTFLLMKNQSVLRYVHEN